MQKSGVLAVAAFSVAPIFIIGSAPARLAALGPQLSIVAPTQVALGEPIEIDVSLRDAPTVAGYEASVRYDESAGDFGGVVFGDGSSSGDVATTVTTDPVGGAAYAAYTCLASGCPASSPGDRAALERVQVRIEPLQAGHHTISFEQLKFVDLQGRSVSVDVPNTTVSVDVGGSTAPTFAPSPVGFALPSDSATSSPASGADSIGVNELAMTWSDARRFGVCNTPSGADPNGDGCLDIADLQLAGASAAAPAGAASSRTEGSIGLAAAVPWVVNSVGDLQDSNLGNSRCETVNGDCTLRAAITNANESPGPDTINFNIPGGGARLIILSSPLPTINDVSGGVTIDGYTQPGSHPNTDPLASNAVITVEIGGRGSVINDPVNGFDAFKLVSGGNVIRGLAIYNVFNHFELFGTGAAGNVIVGNFIGSDAGSTFIAPSRADGGSGVTMVSGAHQNAVGSPLLADRNVIGGTPSTGVRIQHVGSDNNVVQNNLFGLKPAGNAGLPVGFSGIDIQFAAKNNLVGGTGPGEGNVISGAGTANGVDLSHTPQTTGNRVVGNVIGTTPAGNAVFPYTQNFRGVVFKDHVEGNFVIDNVIGGSKQEALWVQFDTTGGNFVSGNRVGVARDGSAVPNSKVGMYVQGHDFQVIGNVFANNATGGILVTQEPGNPIGRSTKNKLSGNTFGANGSGLAIDLASPTGPTANDAGDADSGPNTALNYPVLSPATTTSVTGQACANCSVEIYKAFADGLGRGVGTKLAGAVTTGADGSLTTVLCNVAVGDKIAAIAIDAAGNTSEFSPVTSVTSVGAPAPPGSCGSVSAFHALQPARVLDTRLVGTTVDGLAQGGGLVARGATIELPILNRGGVSETAAAVVLNVTATEGSGPGFVTVYPCGSQRPFASNLNFVAGASVPNAVIAQVGAGGAVCLFVSEGVQLIADVNGFFPPGSGFHPLVPGRFLDTRPGSPTIDGQSQGGGKVARDSTTELTVLNRGDVGPDATAVVLNVTITEPSIAGFATVYPCGQTRPLASNLNFVAGQTVPNQVISQVGVGGKVCLYSLESTQLIVDVSGYFTSESSLVSLLPARLLDTRPGTTTVDGQFQGGGIVAKDGTVALTVAGRGSVSANPGAVVLNVTVDGPQGAGFITVYPCDEARPNASSLNYVAGQAVPNSVIARVSADGKVCFYASAATHLVVDVDGYFPPAP
jgi:hypothetical protein